MDMVGGARRAVEAALKTIGLALDVDQDEGGVRVCGLICPLEVGCSVRCYIGDFKVKWVEAEGIQTPLDPAFNVFVQRLFGKYQPRFKVVEGCYRDTIRPFAVAEFVADEGEVVLTMSYPDGYGERPVQETEE